MADEDTTEGIDCGPRAYNAASKYVEGKNSYMLINERGCYYNRIVWAGADYCIPNGHDILPDDGRPLYSGCDCSDPDNMDPACFPQPDPPAPEPEPEVEAQQRRR